jgi:hypothetical protein
VAVGDYRFRAGDGSYLMLSNTGANGRVALDGVRWVWLGE